MMSIKLTDHILNLLLIITICAISLATYGDLTNFFFTSIDGLTLIETSKVSSPEDLKEILTSPLMATAKKRVLKRKRVLRYRPVSVLSYTVDYSLWKLNPTGYHLTDILIHLGVCLLIFRIVLLIFGDRLKAWLSAVLFTTHPVLAETVPAISRRQDTLMTFFLLAALVMFILHRQKDGRRGPYLAASIVLYCLSLGTKEAAAIFPALIFIYLLLFKSSRTKGFIAGLKRAFRGSAWFILATFFFMLWRLFIFSDLKAARSAGFLPEFPDGGMIFRLAGKYFSGLLCPECLLSMLPEGIRQIPGRFYLWASIAVLLFMALFILSGGSRREAGNCQGPGTTRGAGMALLLAWIIAPLGLYLIVGRINYYYLYFPAFPFTALMAHMIIEGGRSAINPGKSGPLSLLPALRFLFSLSGALTTVIISFLAVTLAMNSPLARGQGEWWAASVISKQVLEGISDLVPSLQPGTVLEIHSLPRRVTSYRTVARHPMEVSYLNRHSIKSWLRLNHPLKQIGVRVRKKRVLKSLPEKLTLDVIGKKGPVLKLRVRPADRRLQSGPPP